MCAGGGGGSGREVEEENEGTGGPSQYLTIAALIATAQVTKKRSVTADAIRERFTRLAAGNSANDLQRTGAE